MISRLPNGLRFHIRPGTTDFNTVFACAQADEYGLAGLDVEGKLVFDIGAHIGGVAVLLAAQGARVIAVEAVPENCEQIHENAQLNGVAERVEVVNAALAPTGAKLVYGWRADASQIEHRFIGNVLDDVGEGEYDVHPVLTCTLSDLVEDWGTPDILKLDCEGGEWCAFEDTALAAIPLVVGEWHPIAGQERRQIEHRFARAGFAELSFTGPEAGPGGFRAVR